MTIDTNSTTFVDGSGVPCLGARDASPWAQSIVIHHHLIQRYRHYDESMTIAIRRHGRRSVAAVRRCTSSTKTSLSIWYRRRRFLSFCVGRRRSLLSSSYFVIALLVCDFVIGDFAIADRNRTCPWQICGSCSGTNVVDRSIYRSMIDCAFVVYRFVTCNRFDENRIDQQAVHHRKTASTPIPSDVTHPLPYLSFSCVCVCFFFSHLCVDEKIIWLLKRSCGKLTLRHIFGANWSFIVCLARMTSAGKQSARTAASTTSTIDYVVRRND